MTTAVTADSVVEWQRFANASEGFVKFGIVDPPCLYKHQVTICACVFGKYIGGLQQILSGSQWMLEFVREAQQ